jgi:hypothetical protein
MARANVGIGQERSGQPTLGRVRTSSPFEPRFINRAPRAYAQRNQRGLAAFQPTFLRWRERQRRAAWARIDQPAISAGRMLTAIHIVIALPQPTLIRPRPFGNGLRKPRNPWLRIGDGCPGAESFVSSVNQRGARMRGPAISSLATLTLDEALAYLDLAEGDEILAAFELARDRNHLDGDTSDPDDAEIHHALFMLRRARGLTAPSFDTMRVQLRRLLPAA